MWLINILYKLYNSRYAHNFVIVTCDVTVVMGHTSNTSWLESKLESLNIHTSEQMNSRINEAINTVRERECLFGSW